jgi:hypothetical protein
VALSHFFASRSHAARLAFLQNSFAFPVSLILLHTSNAVPQGNLHAFLKTCHHLLWLPLLSLFIAIVTQSAANCCLTFAVYNSLTAFYIRIGVGVVWLCTLSWYMVQLSLAATRHRMEAAPALRVRAAHPASFAYPWG